MKKRYNPLRILQDFSGQSLLTWLLLLATCVPAFGQSKDSLVNKPDSANQVLLAGYNSKLAEMEQQRLSDSVNKAKLESQLSSLKTTDNLKKQELQAKLEELKSKDANRVLEKKQQIDSLRKRQTERLLLLSSMTRYSISIAASAAFRHRKGRTPLPNAFASLQMIIPFLQIH